MKFFIFSLTLFLTLSTSAFAKIIISKGTFFIQMKGEKNPIFMVNKLAKENAISKVKLYDDGNVHIISFAKKNEKEQLYSVDSQGYVYSIEPFSSYTVESVDPHGKVKFKEAPGRKYQISSNGFFLH